MHHSCLYVSSVTNKETSTTLDLLQKAYRVGLYIGVDPLSVYILQVSHNIFKVRSSKKRPVMIHGICMYADRQTNTCVTDTSASDLVLSLKKQK